MNSIVNIIEVPYKWKDEKTLENKETIFVIETSYTPGVYSGPYEDSYPDDYDYDIISTEGDDPTDEIYEAFCNWFDNEDWPKYE